MNKTSQVVKGGLKLLGYNTKDNTTINIDNIINVPFVMGAQLSSLSSYLNPILSTFDVLQISASATSVSLSALEYFNRVIPDDTLQAKGLLELCKYFNWTNIGVLYVNDPYGTYLFSSISTEASQIPDFSVTGVSFKTNNNASIRTGVEGIKTSNVWVTILLVHHTDIETVIQYLKDANIWGYPYYYLGCDAWMVYIQYIFYSCLYINVHF